MTQSDVTNYRQSRRPKGTDPVAEHNGYLMITKVPAGAEAFLDKRLLGAGALTAGAYECEIDIAGWEKGLDVVLKPSNVSAGTYAPSVSTRLLDNTTAKTTVAGSNFATATLQTITFPASGSLTGERRAYVTFTVPASDTIEFSVEAGVAEFSGR